MYYDPGALGSSTQPPILFTTHPPPTSSYHPYTPVPYDPYGYSQSPQTSYDPYAHAPSLSIRMPGLDLTQHFSRTQIPLNDDSGPGLQLGAKFFEQFAGSVPVDSFYSGAEYGATARGISSSDVGLDRDSMMSKIARSRQKRPEKSRPPTNPTQRKKSKNDGWEQTGPADGGPQDPVIVPSYSGHVAGCIWHGQNIGILKSRSHYVSLTGWTPSDPAVVHSLFTDKSGNNVPSKLWLLVKNTWTYMYFPMFAPPVRAGARLCKPYIQRFAMLGHKTENKLIDLRIRLDMMIADEVRWILYRSDEISDV
ncbi:hypothetical protein M9H77_04598 [Catharanthus roseus]|uniref:Uncharacterized protein n=1 Tax=Catharanthus roseus TaxID=4058 RepID=A0ACC0CEQ6_CATRO|nr:hypothetical protein M9H77_04598 [Catharanthus roseus]